VSGENPPSLLGSGAVEADQPRALAGANADTSDAATQSNHGERLHPLGLFVDIVLGLPQLIVPALAALFGARRSGLQTPLIVGGLLFGSLVFRWLAWMRFRYHLGSDDIRVERGILNRTIRSIPYDRIQDVSIEEKPLARLLGLCEVTFDSGGGGATRDDARLRFVSIDRAVTLRETIRVRRAEGGAAIVAEDTRHDVPPIFAMDTSRLITLGLYSFSLAVLAILAGLARQFDELLPFDVWTLRHWRGVVEARGGMIDGLTASARAIGASLVLAALISIGFATGIIRTFLREYGFRLDVTERGFRRCRGLLTRTDVVMPIHRVQAATVVTGPVRKRRGWYALRFVSLSQDGTDAQDFVAAPFATADEIWPIVRHVGLTPPDAQAVFRTSRVGWWVDSLVLLVLGTVAAMLVAVTVAQVPLSAAIWMLLVPLLCVPIVWLEWRQYGDHADARQLYVRQGWWRQRLTIAPLMNVQSVEIEQGPIARMLGLSTVHFGIAGGSLAFAAMPLAEARAIRDRVLACIAPVDFSELDRRQ